MPGILIIAPQNDAHANAVSWGLRTLGHKPVTWSWSDFPAIVSGTYHLDSRGRQAFNLKLDGVELTRQFDVIWVRRTSRPSAMPGTHPDDAGFVVAESRSFCESILPRLGHEHTRWVNHPQSDSRCRHKTPQLLLAQGLGFRIPDTLLGNDVHQIRSFLQRHPGGVVHKPFLPMNWENDDGTLTTARTALITSEHLEREFSVRACPGIYQERIEKLHELRVTVIGDTVLAAVIDSQRDGSTIDWRYEGGRGRSNLHSTTISPELAARCRSLCRRLDLAFGCIDLIVTPANDIVFLEVNSAGQFLFKELADPALPMLDSFCRYLATGDAETPVPASARLTMAAFQGWRDNQLASPVRTSAVIS